jgi:hypothetical protein
MKLYLAGPMRGYADFNHGAFTKGAEFIRQCGHDVFSPTERDAEVGFNPVGMLGNEADLIHAEFDLREALGADLAWITSEADGVVVLPGWQRSKGARAEVATAHALNLPVWELALFLLYDKEAQPLGPVAASLAEVTG